MSLSLGAFLGRWLGLRSILNRLDAFVLLGVGCCCSILNIAHGRLPDTE
jgi:hypothetical protein